MLNGPYVLQITGIPVNPLVFPPPPTFSIALGKIPTKVPTPPPPTFILRSGTGPAFAYEFVTPLAGNVKGFVVKITGPDGQSAQRSV